MTEATGALNAQYIIHVADTQCCLEIQRRSLFVDLLFTDSKLPYPNNSFCLAYNLNIRL